MWDEKIANFLRSEGYEVLEFNDWMVFYKDKNGKVWGSSEESVAKAMNENR